MPTRVSYLETGIHYVQLIGNITPEEVLALQKMGAQLAQSMEDTVYVVIVDASKAQIGDINLATMRKLMSREPDGMKGYIFIGASMGTRFVLNTFWRVLHMPNQFAENRDAALELARSIIRQCQVRG